MKKFAIIVAGGVGTRMKSATPKQFLLIKGEPVIIKTVKQFLDFDPLIEIIVVLPENHIAHWLSLKESYPLVSSITIVVGGATRSDSVKAGLSLTANDGLVAIHDAVRPFVSIETIKKSFKSAKEFGSGVAAVALKDSIREIDKSKKSSARNRDNFVLVQTPQTFRIAEIKKAYQLVENQVFSDDASVYEKAGFTVTLTEGSYANIKITTPEDLK